MASLWALEQLLSHILSFWPNPFYLQGRSFRDWHVAGLEPSDSQNKTQMRFWLNFNWKYNTPPPSPDPTKMGQWKMWHNLQKYQFKLQKTMSLETFEPLLRSRKCIKYKYKYNSFYNSSYNALENRNKSNRQCLSSGWAHLRFDRFHRWPLCLIHYSSMMCRSLTPQTGTFMLLLAPLRYIQQHFFSISISKVVTTKSSLTSWRIVD